MIYAHTQRACKHTTCAVWTGCIPASLFKPGHAHAHILTYVCVPTHTGCHNCHTRVHMPYTHTPHMHTPRTHTDTHSSTHTTHVYTTHTHRHTQQCTHMQQCLCNHRDHTSTIGDFPITTVYIAAHLKKAHRPALVWLALLLLSLPPPPRLSKGHCTHIRMYVHSVPNSHMQALTESSTALTHRTRW